MSTLDPFYPIVDSADWVRRLVPAGTKLIQLRIKDRPAEDIRRAVREALAICAAHSAELVVNDFWQIALEEGASFIHLGQGDLDGADLKAIRAKGIRLGLSTHDHAELDRALALDATLIGINNRDLTRLKTDLSTFERLAPSVPRDRLVVAESGLRSTDDLRRMVKAGAHAFLVGESLLRESDLATATRRLLGPG